MYRIGIDVGGSFTDCVLLDDATGEVSLAKVLSTPRAPSAGFLDGVHALRDDYGVALPEVGALVHGTTVGTNAVVERSGARTALVTTRGFRDVLEIGTQQRPRLYDLRQTRAQPLVPRRLCFEVNERIGPRGEVLQPLDADEVRAVLARVVEQGATSVAVCLLFSFANPTHERLVREVAHAEFPQLALSLSCDVCPEFREFVRASTTALNASILPIVSTYLREVERGIAADGMVAPLHVMQSNGGVMSAPEARATPVHLLSSGPAGGVMGGLFFGELAGYRNLITLDMGGTTCDVCLVDDGQPHVSPQGVVEGYPVRVPMIDIRSIGAGGGSIGWVDPWGVLKVGPRSAGADPGPACYDRGGVEPTVTDANLLLGRLDAASFLSGRMEIDVDRARAAVEGRVARPLGVDMARAALSIVDVANANMLRLLRVVSVMRGYDPRDFTLVAFGGAGPVHACALAREVGIGVVVVPPNPGVCSAFGLLTTDVQYTHALSRPAPLAALDLEELTGAFERLEQRGRERLRNSALAGGDVRTIRSIDMRFVGQQYDLNIPVASGTLTPAHRDEMVRQFGAYHAQVYGHATVDDPTEVVNLRVTAVGVIPKPRARRLPARDGQALAPTTTRPVVFAADAGAIACPIYDRGVLRAGDDLVGPCIVEQFDTTVVIEPDCRGRVDPHGSIIIAVDGPAGGRRHGVD